MRRHEPDGAFSFIARSIHIYGFFSHTFESVFVKTLLGIVFLILIIIYVRILAYCISVSPFNVYFIFNIIYVLHFYVLNALCPRLVIFIFALLSFRLLVKQLGLVKLRSVLKIGMVEGKILVQTQIIISKSELLSVYELVIWVQLAIALYLAASKSHIFILVSLTVIFTLKIALAAIVVFEYCHWHFAAFFFLRKLLVDIFWTLSTRALLSRLIKLFIFLKVFFTSQSFLLDYFWVLHFIRLFLTCQLCINQILNYSLYLN